jgi:hypothetical protein
MEDITNSLENLSLNKVTLSEVSSNEVSSNEVIKEDYSNILYICFDCNILIINKILELFNLSKFDIQSKFHITLLYTGGKHNENLIHFVPFLNKSFNIEIDRIAISDKFIVLGISDKFDFPYFGNEIKHITIGKNKKMKLLPKDSPSGFTEGDVLIFKKPYIIDGIIEAVLKTKK